MKISKTDIQTATLGVIAGMRAMSAPAITCQLISAPKSEPLDGTPLSFLNWKTTAYTTMLLALGEFAGDKMPTAPNRIAAPGLIARGVSGALGGAAVYESQKTTATAVRLLAD